MVQIHKWLKKCFVPHAENNFKPHFLRHESFLLFFSLIIVIELGFLVQVFIVFDKTGFLASVLPGVLTSITNEERVENNVGLLTENDLLNKAAQLKAEDMAAKGYFAHTSPEGRTPWYWLEQVGYKYVYAGENLAVNFFESEDVSQAWMNSPTHRANIVKANYQEIGIGVANGTFEGRNTVFVAQFFGTPFAMAAPVQTPSAPTPGVTQPKPAPSPVITPAPITPPITPVATEILGEETTDAKVIQTNETSKESGLKLSLEKTLTSPRQSVNYAYAIIAFFSVLAVFLVVFIRSELRHPYMIARGLGLVAIILVLSFMNLRMLNLEPRLPIEGLSANVIEALPR
ncbi:MAG: CAP domain-containing protein [Patescibacteria group bacterium]